MDKDLKPSAHGTLPTERNTTISTERRPVEDGGVVEYPPVKTELRHGHPGR